MDKIKQVQNVTREMIISHYCEKRSSDDRLDQSGLTMKDFRRLKEYYINYFNREIGAK